MDQNWDQVVWTPGWRNHKALENKHVYYIDLIKEAELLHTAEQGGRVTT